MGGVKKEPVISGPLNGELPTFNEVCDSVCETGALTEESRTSCVIPDLESYIISLMRLLKCPAMVNASDLEDARGVQSSQHGEPCQLLTTIVELKASSEPELRANGHGRFQRSLLTVGPPELKSKPKQAMPSAAFFWLLYSCEKTTTSSAPWCGGICKELVTHFLHAQDAAAAF